MAENGREVCVLPVLCMAWGWCFMSARQRIEICFKIKRTFAAVTFKNHLSRWQGFPLCKEKACSVKQWNAAFPSAALCLRPAAST